MSTGGGATLSVTMDNYFAPKSTAVNGVPEVLLAVQKAKTISTMTPTGGVTATTAAKHAGMAGPLATLPAADGAPAAVVVAFPADNHIEFEQASLALLAAELNAFHHAFPVLDATGIGLLPGADTSGFHVVTVAGGSPSAVAVTGPNASSRSLAAHLCTPGQFAVDTVGTLRIASVTATSGAYVATGSVATAPAMPPVVHRGASQPTHVFTFRTDTMNTTVFRHAWDGTSLTAAGNTQLAGVMSGAAAVAFDAAGVASLLVPMRNGTLVSLRADFSATDPVTTSWSLSNNPLSGVVTAQLRSGDGLSAIVGDGAGKVHAVRLSDGSRHGEFGWPLSVGGAMAKVVQSPAVVTLGTARWLVVAWERGMDGSINTYALSGAEHAAAHIEWPEFQHDSLNSGCVVK